MSKEEAQKEPKEMTIEGIKRIIEKSGYPLEIDIGDMLRRDGWVVFHQYPYIDRNENKLRLIDILSIKPLTKEVGVSLLIECKKSTKHGWAFNTIDKLGEFQSAMAIVGDFLGRLDKHANIVPQLFRTPNWQSKFLPTRLETKIGTHCCIPPSHPDDFHEASHQLLNGLEWLKERMQAQIVFPTIVFDGPIWGFRKEGEKLEVENMNHLQFLSFFYTKDEENVCLVDVLRSSYFSDFLKLVNESATVLKNAITSSGVE